MLADLNGMSPVDVWMEIFSCSKLWDKTFDELNHSSQRNLLMMSLDQRRKTLANLSLFPAERWWQFNSAVGWIPAAASALSWCDDANLEDSLRIIRMLGYEARIERGADFAAQLLNPALRPVSALSAILTAGKDRIGARYLLASLDQCPRRDLQGDVIGNLPDDIRSMVEEG